MVCCYSSLKGVSLGGWGGLVDVLIPARDVLSRAVRPRRPLGQPVLSGSVLVVRGGAGGPSWVAVWSWTGRGAVALVAVVGACGAPVGVGAAVVPLAAWVIALPLEGSSVALENLRILGRQLSAGCDSRDRSEGKLGADLFVRWRTAFAGWVLGLGRRTRGRWRSLEDRAGNRGGRGATTGPIWVSCTRVVNWKRGNK